MNRMNNRVAAFGFGLRTVAMLAVLLTTLLGAATPAAAQDEDMVSVSVAVWIDCLDTDTCNNVMYVPITATTLDGAFLDTCTVTVDPEGPLPGCSVRVPAGTTVVLTEDVGALPAGYAPNENPIIFDTADIGHAQYDAGFGNSLQGTGDTTAQIAEVSTPTVGSDSSGTAQRTWTASVQVILCDELGNCQAGAGITVDIALASGERMGSCTTSEPMPTPWDVFISTCAVEGMPYHEDFVATQDPSTIPPGYAPREESLTLHVEDIHPGGGDQATFTFVNVRTDTGASTSAPSNSSATTEQAGTADPMSILPAIADVPGGLVETGRRPRTLPEVAANYTDPAATTHLFTGWGWQGNAIASFALPSGQQAQSGQVNGVYVSIHRFKDADAAREALDFSLTEQAAGTSLQEIPIDPLGEHTRALYGPMDYGNETTILTQQGSVFIRVSAAMLDGDPTADAVAVTRAILKKVAAQPPTMIEQETSGTTGSTITPDSGNASGAGGLTVQFWDLRNNVPDNTSQCVQLVGATGVLCAIDFPDGQIQMNGIPAGTYEVCVTRFYPDVPGEPVWAWFRSPASVTIAPGSHETVTLNLYMDFEPGERTLCGFDDTTSASDESASSSTAGTTIVADTSGSTMSPAPGGSGEATLLMTFRGCPEGFDPATGDFFSECTEPLDAPDNAFLDYHGEGQGGMNIAWMDRHYNGEYIYTAGPSTMNVELSGLAPVVRDNYQVIGADGADGNGYTVNLADGETREVYVFYWFS